jgi:hypothetical protein
MSLVVRPDWWCCPLQCPTGQLWAPGAHNSRLDALRLPQRASQQRSRAPVGPLLGRRLPGDLVPPDGHGLTELARIVLVAAWCGGCRALTALWLVAQVRLDTVVIG